MTDPIADMLSRIRNAMAVRKPEVVLPFSKIKFAVAEIMQKSGYVVSVEKVAKGTAGNPFDQLKIVLKYNNGKEPAIRSIVRVSKPGRRVYASKEKLPVVLNNIGIAIISTPHGVMTNKEAKQKNIGGEVICEIY